MKTTVIRTLLFLLGWLAAKFLFGWTEAILIGLVFAYCLEGAIAQAWKP